MNNVMNMLTQMMSMSNNPQQILQMMSNQNPQVVQLMNQVKQSGMSPKQFAMQYAQQNNIDISPMLNMFNQKGIKL